MVNHVHVVICANDYYGDYAAALVASILSNSALPELVAIHLFNRQEDSKLIKTLSQIVIKYGAKITEYHLPPAAYRQLPAKDYKSLDAYSRLFAPRMVGEGIDKLIYLDIDTIVRVDLQELLNIDLHNNTIGAVRDLEYELGEGKSPLFNSGVMVIDVKRWKERKIEEQVLLEIRHSQGGIVPLADQDDLNEILHSDWCELPPQWNVMSGNIYKHEIHYKNAKILHFNGGTVHKPDHIKCVNPGKKEYFKYLRIAKKSLMPILYMPTQFSRILKVLTDYGVLQ